MTSFDLLTCSVEDFVAEVTPQSGSLEEAASTQEILIQQIEGYLNRLREAVCTDLQAIQANCCDSAGGGEVWKISERRQEATVALPSTFPEVPFNFTVAGINDAPGELSWDAINFAWENISGATLYCNVVCTIACQNVGSGRPAFVVKRDTGGGFLDEPGGNFWSEVGRMSASKVLRLDMAPGDKIAIGARTIVGSTNMIASSSFQIHSRTTTP